MRAIIWVIIAIVCIIPIAYIAVIFFSAPSKTDVQAQRDYITVWKNFADDKQTDAKLIGGDQPDNEYVRLLAAYLNSNLDVQTKLSDAKNNITLIIRPQNIASTPNIYELLEKEGVNEKSITGAQEQYEASIQQLIDKVQGLDKKKLKMDVVAFVEEVEKNKASDEKEIQLYVNLAQHTKTFLEFVGTRKGYFQLGNDGFLHFTRPEDEQYYVKIMNVLNYEIKSIEDQRDQDIKNIRNFVNQMGG